jgi:hypothetical protein
MRPEPLSSTIGALPMMPLRDAESWLGTQLARTNGRLVTYRRRDLVLPLVGWLASNLLEVEDEDGIPQRIQSLDWTFRAADLVLGDEAIMPRPGDQIVEIEDGDERVYEVMALDRQPCWVWLGTGQRLVLVHTKRVE